MDRIWIDLETRGKEARQRNMNTVKSNHSIEDIRKIKPLLSRAEMMVRINPWYENSWNEVNEVIEAGADVVMLPYWKTPAEVQLFLTAVNGRCKTSLLLETKEAVECVDQVLKLKGIDEIHIGLNDLHLSYGMSFMFIVTMLSGSNLHKKSPQISPQAACFFSTLLKNHITKCHGSVFRQLFDKVSVGNKKCT